jgi:hypothetical protein
VRLYRWSARRTTALEVITVVVTAEFGTDVEVMVFGFRV